MQENIKHIEAIKKRSICMILHVYVLLMKTSGMKVMHTSEYMLSNTEMKQIHLRKALDG